MALNCKYVFLKYYNFYIQNFISYEIITSLKYHSYWCDCKSMYSRDEATREECAIGSSSNVRRKDQKVPGGERYWALCSPVLVNRPLIYCPDNLIYCAITVLFVLYSECFVNVFPFRSSILMLNICLHITLASCFFIFLINV